MNEFLLSGKWSPRANSCRVLLATLFTIAPFSLYFFLEFDFFSLILRSEILCICYGTQRSPKMESSRQRNLVQHTQSDRFLFLILLLGRRKISLTKKEFNCYIGIAYYALHTHTIKQRRMQKEELGFSGLEIRNNRNILKWILFVCQLCDAQKTFYFSILFVYFGFLSFHNKMLTSEHTRLFFGNSICISPILSRANFDRNSMRSFFLKLLHFAPYKSSFVCRNNKKNDLAYATTNERTTGDWFLGFFFGILHFFGKKSIQRSYFERKKWWNSFQLAIGRKRFLFLTEIMLFCFLSFYSTSYLGEGIPHISFRQLQMASTRCTQIDGPV